MFEIANFESFQWNLKFLKNLTVAQIFRVPEAYQMNTRYLNGK